MPDSPKPSYQTPDVLSDLPLTAADDDKAHFHFDEFAVTLARLIADKKTRTPLTIGVSGSWGAGKTTLLRRLQRQLDQTRCLLDREKPVAMDFVNPHENPEQQFRVCRTVWFNAWKYANEDALLVALVRVIVQTMYADDFISKGLATILEPFTERRDVIDTVLSWFSIKTPIGDFTPSTGETKPTPFAEKTAMLDLFDEAFDRLMAAWVHRKLDSRKIDPLKGVLVVFIDDLDRCIPNKTVQVLEAVKLFLDKPGCIFVLGADEEVVTRAVEGHYQNIGVIGQNAADYLEKIIQLRFDLPPVTDSAMQDFLKEKKVSAEMMNEWRTLLAAAAVNPRRVKAVLNDIDLQWRMLVNSGQAEGVQRADFIRWNAMLRAAPASLKERLFDIEDLELRLKFVQDALRWGNGEAEEVLTRTFQEYEREGRRIKRVLRQLQTFSPEFDARTLDAFIHLTAPPTRTVSETTAQPPGVEALQERPEIKAALGRGEAVAGMVVQTWGGMPFVKVPAGKFLMGSKEDNSLAYDDEKPQHTVDIPQELWIGRFPVTNSRFTDFVQVSGYRTTAEEKGSGYTWSGVKWEQVKGACWRNPRGPESNLQSKEDHPVTLVSWLDSQAFCRWLSQAHGDELPEGWLFRLPTEAEWEKAARGEYGNEWPWGNEEPDADHCNFEMNVGDTTPVGRYSPQGDSPYGAADMAGNVWEWTHTLFKAYPYRSDDGREVEDSSKARLLRGGSFYYYRRLVRCASRDGGDPDNPSHDFGFRVVASPIRL